MATAEVVVVEIEPTEDEGSELPTPTPTDSCAVSEQQQQLAVFLEPPADTALAMVVFELTYDPQRVVIPGTRNDSLVEERVQGFPKGTVNSMNDKGGTLGVAMTSTSPIPSHGSMFTIAFDVCQGAEIPVSTDYTCTIKKCAAAKLVPVDGCGCRVEIVPPKSE